MAHVAKYNKGAMGHVLAHYDRTKEIDDHVDVERIKLNYNLAKDTQPLGQLDFIHKRLSEVRCQNRKDVNVLCDWIVTAPKDLPGNEQKRFFEETYKFLCGRYGSGNVVSAYVHMDEVTPHMHFAFVPVIKAAKKVRENPYEPVECYKVSAKEVITKRDLQTFHNDLQKHLSKAMGHEVSVLNEATKNGNKSIEELKRGSAVKELEEAHEKASKIVFKASKEFETLNSTINALKAEKRILGASEVDAKARDVKTTFFDKDKVVIPKKDYEALVRTAKGAEKAVKEATALAHNYNGLMKKAQKTVEDAETKAKVIIGGAEQKSMKKVFSELEVKRDLEQYRKMEKAFPKQFQQMKDALKTQSRSVSRKDQER